jgi:hypothetical protein
MEHREIVESENRHVGWEGCDRFYRGMEMRRRREEDA